MQPARLVARCQNGWPQFLCSNAAARIPPRCLPPPGFPSELWDNYGIRSAPSATAWLSHTSHRLWPLLLSVSRALPIACQFCCGRSRQRRLPLVGGPQVPGSGPCDVRGFLIVSLTVAQQTGPLWCLPAPKPQPQALLSQFWKDPRTRRRTARPRSACIPFFARWGAAASGKSARWCCVHSAPGGVQRFPAPLLPLTARYLCCRIRSTLCVRGAFGRRCKRGRQRWPYCAEFTRRYRKKQSLLGGKIRVCPPNAAPTPAGPKRHKSLACST